MYQLVSSLGVKLSEALEVEISLRVMKVDVPAFSVHFGWKHSWTFL